MKKLILNYIVTLALILFMGNNSWSAETYNSVSTPISICSAIGGCELETE